MVGATGNARLSGWPNNETRVNRRVLVVRHMFRFHARPALCWAMISKRSSNYGATHLFEEPATIEEVARLALNWFQRKLHTDVGAEGSRRRYTGGIT